MEMTVDQSCSEPSSVKLNKEVKNDLKESMQSWQPDLSVRALQLYLLDGSEKPCEKPCYQLTIVHSTRADSIKRTALAGQKSTLI